MHSLVPANKPFHFPLCCVALAVCGTLAFPAEANDWFNPNFLSTESGAVADLSRFESGEGQAPGMYRVDVWVNDDFITTSNLRFDAVDKTSNAQVGSIVDDTGLYPCLSLKWLRRFGLDTTAIKDTGKIVDNTQCLDVAHFYPGVTSHFDFSGQKLFLTFPQVALQNSARGYIPPEEWDEGINAGLLNYTLTGDHGHDNESHYLNLNGGLNVGAWRFRHNSAWSYTNYRNGHRQSRWRSISTYAQRTLIPFKSELILGDSSSESTVFDSLGLRGVRLYSSESMYPDSQQGYAPTIRGTASGRSKVIIRQNGYVIYQNVVQAGAFEINDLNPTSSSGDLDVTVEADGGGTQHFTVPYSMVPLLQREKRLKYEAVAGRYRNGDSDKNAPFFVQGTLARGFGNGVTLYGGTQIAGRYQSLAVGAGRNLGRLGAVSVDLTSARSRLVDDSEHQGQSLRFLYARTLNTLGTNVQLLGYRYSTSGFYTLDEVAWDSMRGYQYNWQDKGDGAGYRPEPVSYHDLRRNKKGRLQLDISQQLGDFGSLYLSGSQQTYWNSQGSDRWYQAGYSSGWNGISYNLSLSMNRTVGLSGTNRLVSFNVSVPFGRWLGHNMVDRSALNSMYTTAQASRDQDGISTVRTGVSGTLLKDNNLSYSVMQGHNSHTGESGSLNATWRGTYGTASAGYSHSRYDHSLNWDISGGAVVHANGVTLSQPLGDTNVLIKAPGAKGVSVENETGVKTDWRGYAVMPYATVYRRNRVALDVNSLDSHTDLDDNVQSVVPTEGALVRAEYTAHTGVRALLTLMRDGHPIPFGAMVTEQVSGVTGIAGEGGQVYLVGVPMKGTLKVVWANGTTGQCRMPFSLPENSEQLPVVQMTLVCNKGN
ncbi:fimbrial protein [Klebsiella sp. A-Nf5]|uniref:outer membrane usher protein FimD n=1 Tax=Klebsiella sp. A-Nf5 TaxID=2054608 RepID=UPI000C2AEA41|nr:outer membrane usher protein FimD [Klebsiella sp. A-Nf5]PJX32793.1 fimbrial protein [Klebsiella sp. A-Nf5]